MINNTVKGIKISRDHKDRLRQGVDAMMKEKIEPMVYLHQYDVIFYAIEGDLHVIGKDEKCRYIIAQSTPTTTFQWKSMTVSLNRTGCSVNTSTQYHTIHLESESESGCIKKSTGNEMIEFELDGFCRDFSPSDVYQTTDLLPRPDP